MGLEWKSSGGASTWPNYFGATGGELNFSLAAVNMCTAQSPLLGVVSAVLLGVKYSSSSLGKSYGSKDN